MWARHRLHSLVKVHRHSSHPRSDAAHGGDDGDVRDGGEVHAEEAFRRSCPSLDRRQGVRFRIRHSLELTLCSTLTGRSCPLCSMRPIVPHQVDCLPIGLAATPVALHGPFEEQLGCAQTKNILEVLLANDIRKSGKRR